MGDNNKKVCLYCKGAAKTGKKCPKCGCLFHDSCAERQPKTGKWLCCQTHKHRTQHALLDNTRLNGSNVSFAGALLQPSTSTSVAPINVADVTIPMNTSQSEESSAACKQEQLSPLPPSEQNNDSQRPASNEPSASASQMTGITLEQLSTMLAAELQCYNEGIYSRIDSLASQISVIDTRVQPVAELAEKVNDIDTRVSALENNPPQQVPQMPNIVNLAAEIQERILRSQNIIMYGVAENSSSQADTENIISILSKVPAIDLTNVVARRLGKTRANGPPRPILVRLQSAPEVRRILRNRHVIPRPVAVSTDKTVEERLFLKSLIEQVNAHNAANPSNRKKIKYVNGVPTIVDDNTQQRAQKN